MLYRSKTDLSACPVTFIATVSGIPAWTRFRTALLLKSWGTLPCSPASLQAIFQDSLMHLIRLPLRWNTRHAREETAYENHESDLGAPHSTDREDGPQCDKHFLGVKIQQYCTKACARKASYWRHPETYRQKRMESYQRQKKQASGKSPY